MTTDLARAIDIFRELGWEDAALEELPNLPLGTAAQQKEALAGLRKGEWGSFADLGENTFGWRSSIDVDTARLGVFTIRLGADARRTIDVLPTPHALADGIQAEIIAQRGPAFAAEFIALACVSRRRAWVNSTSVYGGAAVRLVHMLGLEIPRTVEYLKDWSAFAAAALGRPAEIFPDRDLIDAEVIRERFIEHARVAVEQAQPATASLGEAFPAAYEAGWMSRDETLELAFIGLETAQRPGDRAVWARVIADTLAATDDELLARANALVPVLSAGDAAVVELLAPRLIAASDDHLLVELAAGALAVKGKKTRLSVLASLAARPRPQAEGSGELVEQVRALTGERDAALVKAAQNVLDGWGTTRVDDEQAGEEGRGSWQPTPEVWTAPRLESEPAEPEALAATAGRLLAKPEEVHDVEAEIFLDQLVRLAHRDLHAARTALRGVKQRWAGGLHYIAGWVAGDLKDTHLATRGLMVTREFELLSSAGRVPVMLSTPSWVDLRIDPRELLARLRVLHAEGAAARASDLVLALVRLDLSLIAEELQAGFAGVSIPVVDHEDRTVAASAGAVVVAYMADPVVEPPLEPSPSGDGWRAADVVVPRSLHGLCGQLSERSWRSWHDGAVFPTWTETVGEGFESYPFAARGVMLRQGARHAAPYGRPVAARFIGALRQLHPRAAEDAFTAVIEAFERGLLRPELIDVEHLDASDLAAMARVCLELADEGLASVVWPLLDGLIVESLAAPRMLSGTAELADALAQLVPTALAAVDDGIAPTGILAVPGLRALASRSGSSRAVTAAKSAVAALPAMESAPVRSAPEGPAFDDVWPEGAGAIAAVVDGATITAEWADPDAKTKMLAIDLRPADAPDQAFRIAKPGWTYDLENEGQCSAIPWRDGRPDPDGRSTDQIYLAWDGARLERLTGREPGVHRGPLTTSMHAVVLAALCHDGEWGDGGIYLVANLTANDLIGWDAVRHVMPALLACGDVSPARMMRAIEKEPRTIAVLWPVITESIAFAARAETLPHWLNRVLDMAGLVLPQLVEAARRGWIPADAAHLSGIGDIAKRPGRQAALVKARALTERAGA